MSGEKKTIIIAEAGVNHNGDLELAKKMIDTAVEAGADYIKFQTFKTDLLVSRNAPKADYQKQTTDKNETQFGMIRKLELDEESHHSLKKHCLKMNIGFTSSPFDLPSIDFLYDLGIDFFKIPSGEITNYPYLKRIAQKQLPVVMSTGMANIDEIKHAIDALLENGLTREMITLLHANTEYPTPMTDVNLRAMLTLKKEFGVEVGYSDHTLGIEIPVAAVAMGATVIEKHFTLDKTLPGPDHKASLDPRELKAMIRAIRNIEKALGDGIKKASNSEKKNIPIARKSLHAKCPIKKGEVFTEENLIAKRPGTGISPMRWNEIIGRKAPRDFHEDEIIEI